jgi:hypothetical protein
MAQPNNLRGLWVVMPSPDPGYEGYIQTGQITRSIGEHHLVKIRPTIDGAPAFSRLLSSAELTVDDVYIFDTEPEMDEWLVVMEAAGDNGPRVVPLRKDGPAPKDTH